MKTKLILGKKKKGFREKGIRILGEKKFQGKNNFMGLLNRCPKQVLPNLIIVMLIPT